MREKEESGFIIERGAWVQLQKEIRSQDYMWMWISPLCHCKLFQCRRAPIQQLTMRLGGPPQIQGTSRKPVGLDMPSYKCLCQMLCSDCPAAWRPNGSYSPSRPTWGGLRTQTLLLAEQRCARLVSTNSSVQGSVSERQGHGPCAPRHGHPSGIAQFHVRTAATYI